MSTAFVPSSELTRGVVTPTPADGAERTCRLVTLGCKVNQYETQLVKESLERNGFREAVGDEPADLCVVNTCTVTHTGDSKSRQIVRRLARQNPDAKTVVMGCYATNDPEAVAALPNVVEVVTDKRELPDVFGRLGVGPMADGITRFDDHSRAFVKVQDGCVLRCTYCIIPQVRPGLRSRTPEGIRDEVRGLIDAGYREIVLAGIHVGHFGVDTTRKKSGKPPFRLWHLFRMLDEIPGDWRMRLSSVEAAEIDDDFISAAADCEHLCRQFHPALQSGSNGVLKRMRRRYTVEKFLAKVDRLRDRLGDVALTTDVIVGFPGETDAEYAETVETCRRADFMKVHVFPFSRRRGTPAFDMPDQVPDAVRKERVRHLGEVERDLAVDFYRRQIGRPLEVLVERTHESQPGVVRGTDRTYAPVEMPGGAADIGKLVPAVGVDATREVLFAERIG